MQYKKQQEQEAADDEARQLTDFQVCPVLSCHFPIPGEEIIICNQLKLIYYSLLCETCCSNKLAQSIYCGKFSLGVEGVSKYTSIR